jgi:ABC-type glutathione transport system ATPase component
MSLSQPNPRPTITVNDLTLEYESVRALSNVTTAVGDGRILGIVGESGSGKSTLARAILGLLPEAARITGGEILFDGMDLSHKSASQLRDLRGQRITYVSQDPLRALTPTLTIGDQMTDIQYRSGIGSSEKRTRAIAILERVGMPDPERRLSMYPHELSGGQRQRVSIAMAVMMRPDLLIADEATTALDATLEQEIIKLLRELQSEIGCSMLFVTHHLGVVASLCDDVVVMHRGEVKEQGTVAEVFGNPQDPYTKMLLRCDPAWIEEKTRHLPITSDDPDAPIVIETGPPDRIKTSEPPVLEISGLDVTFSKKAFLGGLFGDAGFEIRAVKGASLQLHKGETVAIVGESGSGKTTIARTVIGLQDADKGSVRFDGRELTRLSPAGYKSVRREITFMFQDPIGSLSPRMRVGDAVVEPLRIHGIEKPDYHAEAERLLGLVGLDANFLDRYPHELSGGQARRVAVARAIALEPKLIIADEPTAGLDVSIQGEVLNLLAEIQDRTGVAMLLITHNLNVVRHISDRVAIMFMGDFLEIGETETIFKAPRHDYTRRLIAANHHPSFRS